MSTAIGGYFGLETPAQVARVQMPGALRFCSARAAFGALLRFGRPGRIWIPWYVCSAMVDAAVQAGTEVLRYRIEDDGAVDASLEMESNDWLLCVNQFGMRGAQVLDAISRFGAHRVVVDHAQAWFSGPSDCLANLYSPRKFAGLPDGGLLCTSLPIPVPPGDDPSSTVRMRHLHLRADGKIREGLAAFRAAERSLANEGMTGMSSRTSAMLDCIDFSAFRTRRRKNFEFLACQLKDLNHLDWAASASEAPLCYPILVGRGGRLRDRLVNEGIFCPVFWPEIGDLEAPDIAWERRLAADALCLPIDHRYGHSDMQRIVEAIHAALATT